MGTWFPSVTVYLTGGLSVLIVTLSLTTIFSSEDWGPWTDGDSALLTFPTIRSLAFLKFVNRSLEVDHLSSKYGLSSWYNMTYILEFLDLAILIQTYGSVDVILIAVHNISSNTTQYCGEIEPVHKVITNPSWFECILMNTILTPLWILVPHLGIFNPGFCYFGSKEYARKPQTWQLLRFYDTGSNLNLDHISIADNPDCISGIILYIHTA